MKSQYSEIESKGITEEVYNNIFNRRIDELKSIIER